MSKIELDAAAYKLLEGKLKRGQLKARVLKRLHILLKLAEGGAAEAIAESAHSSVATVYNVRKRYLEGGVEGVLADKVQQKRRRALSGAAEAFIIATACSPVPEGHDHWTVQMLHARLIAMGLVEKVSPTTVYAALKKMNLNLGSRNHGASPKRLT
jgi:transposase